MVNCILIRWIRSQSSHYYINVTITTSSLGTSFSYKVGNPAYSHSFFVSIVYCSSSALTCPLAVEFSLSLAKYLLAVAVCPVLFVC